MQKLKTIRPAEAVGLDTVRLIVPLAAMPALDPQTPPPPPLTALLSEIDRADRDQGVKELRNERN